MAISPHYRSIRILTQGRKPKIFLWKIFTEAEGDGDLDQKNEQYFWRKVSCNFEKFQQNLRSLAFPQCGHSKRINSSRSILEIIL